MPLPLEHGEFKRILHSIFILVSLAFISLVKLNAQSKDDSSALLSGIQTYLNNFSPQE